VGDDDFFTKKCPSAEIFLGRNLIIVNEKNRQRNEIIVTLTRTGTIQDVKIVNGTETKRNKTLRTGQDEPDFLFLLTGRNENGFYFWDDAQLYILPIPI